MQSAVSDRGFPTDSFHDVDLAAVRPASSVDVVTQHPKCWPDTLAVRDLDSGFKPSVGLAELVLCEQSCGSVVAGDFVRPRKGFLERFDYQPTILDIRVCCAAGIGFQFVVTPAVTADIK
jgi:hypothetical protein